MPRYTLETLGPREKILCEAHYHWFYWAKQLIFCVAAFAIGAVLDLFVLTTGVATVVAFFVCAASLAWAYIVYQNDEMVITNTRVVLKTGFFTRYVFEMQIQKIETVLVDQSIFGRLFDYGAISCRGTGGTGSKKIVIAAPLKFRAAFQEAQASRRSSESQALGQIAPASALTEEKLDEMIRLLRSIDSKLGAS